MPEDSVFVREVLRPYREAEERRSGPGVDDALDRVARMTGGLAA